MVNDCELKFIATFDEKGLRTIVLSPEGSLHQPVKF